MADEFNFNDNTGQINVAKDNAKINAEQNKGSKNYTISGGTFGAVGDNASGSVTINNQVVGQSDIEKIKDLIAKLVIKVQNDSLIENKEPLEKALNVTNKQLKNDDKEILEICVNNLEAVSNRLDKGTEIFIKIISLVGLIKKMFGF